MQEIKVPQTLNDPPLAMIFNAYQLMTVLGFAMIGSIIDQLLIMTIVGWLAGTLFTRFSDKKPDGFLRHQMYYWGLPVLSPRFQNGLDREFRP